jgi:hypothetical protein
LRVVDTLRKLGRYSGVGKLRRGCEERPRRHLSPAAARGDPIARLDFGPALPQWPSLPGGELSPLSSF